MFSLMLNVLQMGFSAALGAAWPRSLCNAKKSNQINVASADQRAALVMRLPGWRKRRFSHQAPAGVLEDRRHPRDAADGV